MATFQLNTSSLALRFDEATSLFSVDDAAGGIPLIQTNRPLFLQPWLDSAPAEITLADVHSDDRSMTFRYEGPLVPEMTVRMSVPDGEDAIDVSCAFTVLQETQLNRLALFPEGTGLNLQEVVNFRNRHYTRKTWPELILGGKGCETNTGSTDWQFAPHPTAFLLRYNEISLFCGTLDLSPTFGMFFSAGEYKVRHWYLDYGTKPDGLALVAGQRVESPAFRIFARKGFTPHEVYEEFGEMLIRAGRIPDPALKHREAWWREPLYCTWIDQCFGSKFKVADDLQQQAKGAAENNAITFLNDALVRSAVAEIEKEKYPIRTILIDDGWMVTRGQWEPATGRLPDLRKLVDDLHAKGLKVVVWWNWAEIMPGAEANAAHLMGGGKLNRHGARVRDYSSPLTQDEYLRPLFRKLFSSEPGCFNLDGVKTDFLADKVHPDMPLHDPSWRGEENYFFHVTQLFYSELKKIKPDGIHIGCAGNYWLADLIDINRTYDVASGNWVDHEERAKMLGCTTPGCPVAYDFHNYLDGMKQWFDSARRIGASVQIGNVLWYRKDRFSEPQPADSDYRAMLHHGLG